MPICVYRRTLAAQAVRQEGEERGAERGEERGGIQAPALWKAVGWRTGLVQLNKGK